MLKYLWWQCLLLIILLFIIALIVISNLIKLVLFKLVIVITFEWVDHVKNRSCCTKKSLSSSIYNFHKLVTKWMEIFLINCPMSLLRLSLLLVHNNWVCPFNGTVLMHWIMIKYLIVSRTKMFIDLSLSMVFYHYLSVIPIYCMNGQYSYVFFFFIQNQNYLYFQQIHFK